MENLTKTIETLRANHPDCTIILIEPHGDKAVVSADFILPERWYVENFDKAMEWVKGVKPAKIVELRSESPAITSDGYGFNPLHFCDEYTQITKQQFIDYVYLPWKTQQEKPKYWRLITEDGYLSYDKNQIYPSSFHRYEGSKSVGEMQKQYPNDWQPATESEYLAQEAAKQPEQGAPFDEVKTQRPNYDISNMAEPKKFDPKTADKTKMYFAVHKEHGEGIVWYCDGWKFESSDYYPDRKLSNCTHIDHEPIQGKN